MKFFIPLASSDKQAERIHARIASRLEEQGYQFSQHRIARVTYWRVDKLATEAVGEHANQNGEIVLAIFKNEVGYFVCTYSLG